MTKIPKNRSQATQHAFLLLSASVLLLIFSLSGCKEKASHTPPPPATVKVAKPVIKDVINYIYFTGFTQAVESVEIRARVEGVLESFKFISGTMVKKGNLLFVIERKSYEAKLKQAQADLVKAKAQRELATTTLKRKESAYRERAVSELTVLEAKAGVNEADAEVKGAEAAVDIARIQLSYTKIYSPITGRISRNMVDPGNLVGAGGDKTFLAKVLKYDPIYVYFNIDERSMLMFKRYRRTMNEQNISSDKIPVEMGLEGDTGYPYKGIGNYKQNEMDRSTGTLEVRAIFNNADMFLIPGLFARIRIPHMVDRNALLVPEYALSTDQRGKYLIVVNSDNVVEYRPVKTGILVDGMRVIKKGIKQGERIIVEGLLRARPGVKVNPSPGDTPVLKSQKNSQERDRAGGQF